MCVLVVFLWWNQKYVFFFFFFFFQWTGIMQVAGEFCGVFPSIRGTSAWSCDGCMPSTASTLSSALTLSLIPTFPTRASSEWVSLFFFFSFLLLFLRYFRQLCWMCLVESLALPGGLGGPAGAKLKGRRKAGKWQQWQQQNSIKRSVSFSLFAPSHFSSFYRDRLFSISLSQAFLWSCIPIWIFTSSKSDEKRLRGGGQKTSGRKNKKERKK